MPTLLEKIQTSADQRLKLPPNRLPREDLAPYKRYLKVETHRLKMAHRAGAEGRRICQARAAILDALIRNVFEAFRTRSPQVTAGRTPPPPLALVALGGYGRAELNPHSDIDLMFLHNGDLVSRGRTHQGLAALTDGVLYTLWDLGFKVGHSVRSIEDCIRVANGDMQSKTSLIEARLLAGDEPLFKRFQKAVLTRCVAGHEEAYIEARLRDQAARREKYGNSPCMQEPNVKNGCGGLRDYQNLLWMAFFKYRTRSLDELEERDHISAGERKQLEAAYDFLLRVRTELHEHLDRPVDTLPKSVQPAIASNLGYPERSPRRRIERFMRDYYTHARNIDLLTRTVEQRLALLPQPKRLPSLRQIIRTRRQRANQRLLDGFRLVDGEIHPGSSRVFRDQPRRLMRVFLHAQQRGHRLHPDLAQLIRRQLHLVDRSFLRDSHVHQTFLEILNQRGNVAPILRAMHEVGFLGKYIPEFGRLTCLVQHEFYHQYAADEHTLVCLAKLDQVWEAEQAPYSHYTEMFQNLEQPFLLYLALLLHDAGKAFETENHALLGGEIAMKPGKRLGLDTASLHSLRLVIENHLAMAQISQRRDLEDPAVIRKFAALIESPANLTLLTLHTFADSQGTSDQLWNGFKDTLLRALHHKTLEVLMGGTEFILAEARRREQLAAEARRLLPATIGEEEINAHFANLPARYFQRHSARDICTDLTLTHRFLHLQSSESDNVLEPVIHWHNEPDRGYTVAKVCTWDRAGLFSKIAGTFTAAGLTILSAGIISRRDGIVLDTFCVMDAAEGKPAGREQRERCESLLTKVLTGGAVDFESLIGRLQVRRPIYQPLQGERIPTRIEFDNTSSDARTLIEVETEDRLGLLYAISRKLAALDLDISVAKICTEKGAAIDSFYVREADGRKIESPERQREIERGLIKAVAALDKAD